MIADKQATCGVALDGEGGHAVVVAGLEQAIGHFPAGAREHGIGEARGEIKQAFGVRRKRQAGDALANLRPRRVGRGAAHELQGGRGDCEACGGTKKMATRQHGRAPCSIRAE